jgi:hypothetical protein
MQWIARTAVLLAMLLAGSATSSSAAASPTGGSRTGVSFTSASSTAASFTAASFAGTASAPTASAVASSAAQEPEKAKGKEKEKETPKEAPPKETPDSPQAAVVKEMLGVMDKLTEALSGIKDSATAEAAKPELRKLAKAWTAVRDKAEKTPPPSKEEKARLEKDFKSQMELAQRKLFGEAGRVRNIPGAGDALQEIRSVLTRTMK